MGSANERRCYIVTPSLIGWAHTQNDLWFQVPGSYKYRQSTSKDPGVAADVLASNGSSNVELRALIQYKDVLLPV